MVKNAMDTAKCEGLVGAFKSSFGNDIEAYCCDKDFCNDSF
jgi:hypothetical protein